MTYKNYAVVVLPRDEENIYNQLNGNGTSVYTDYDSAFDGFNAAVTDVGGEQLYRQPRGEQPLRAVTKDYYVELWVITRTAEPIKNKD